jgi:hypothetical protein
MKIMSMRTAELVTEWDSVPFDGGHEGLRALADREFSGAVVSGSTRLFMLNGRVVGIPDGDLETFENGGGTARQAPHDALPLLAVMQGTAGEPRAQYYTEDTPVSEVDRTLTDGKFTGYVELSENVLSGDYYLVYHQGRSMSVAWVGSSQRLVTDDEAFEQADDEVGIYDVVPAEIEPVELPEPEPDTAVEEVDTSSTEPAGGSEFDTAPTETAGESEADTPPAEPAMATDSDDEFAESAIETDTGDTTERRDDIVASSRDERSGTPSGPPGSKAAGASQGSAVDSGRSAGSDRPEPELDGAAADHSVGATDVDTGTDEATADSTPQREPASSAGESRSEPRERESATAQPEPATERTAESGVDEENTASQSAAETSAATATAFETRSIPSLDPGRSSSDAAVTPDPTRSEPAAEPSPPTDDQPAQSPSEPSEQREQSTGTPAPQREQVTELEGELDERESQIGQLESEIRDLSTENEELAAERDRLQSALEEARAEIQRLEEQLESAEMPASGGVQLTPGEAIDGTNLFVRYHSKGEATLAKAQSGSADRAAVEENLRLEYHTQFDAADAVVDGAEFETFLQESIHYRFVNWLVRELLYEIRDTGHANPMSVLYEALPEVDRAELNGNVSVVYTENGKEHREQEQFDVVVRDRMGNPLVVANINDSREPATNGQMTDIVQTAERVGNSSGSLAGAFLVTSSFFEPEALETAEEATSSGLFSRDKRKSFVNLSRKDGYHLCLLEARNNEFHLAVPEL